MKGWMFRGALILSCIFGLASRSSATRHIRSASSHDRQPLKLEHTFVQSTGFEPNIPKYTAFGGIEKVSDSHVVACITRGTSHGSRDTRIWILHSPDGGYSWPTAGNETLFPFNISGVANRGCALRATPSGDLFILWGTDGYATFPSRFVHLAKSSDGGFNWSLIPTASVALGSQFTFPGGPLAVLEDDSLLLPVYWKNIGENSYTVSVFRSDSNGLIWDFLSHIAQPGTQSGIQYEEPQIGQLSDGRILALVRVDHSRDILTFYSENQGLTWSDATFAFDGWGWPNWQQVRSGLVYAFTRTSLEPFRGTAWVSSDTQTWRPLGEFQDPAQGMYVYHGVAKLGPNRIILIHSQETSVSVARTRTLIEIYRTR